MQLALGIAEPFNVERVRKRFPSTRYQGSKYKLLPWISQVLGDLQFDSALDAFGGTGSVAYLMKAMGKQVTYNDKLLFNSQIGLALIENDSVTLPLSEVDILFEKRPDRVYPTFIEDTFPEIYFLDDENKWLDVVATNIFHMPDPVKRSIAYFALYQACISKRPFNLFHRKNLYVRTAEVERSFGNKATWERPFPVAFREFVNEANAAVFANGRKNQVLNSDIGSVQGKFDLVYIDPPYVSPKGVGLSYLEFYHFLEGLTDYPNWSKRVDWKSKHRRIKDTERGWTKHDLISKSFDNLFQQFQESTLVVSYRSPGIPSQETLVELMRRYKKNVEVVTNVGYQYVLSTAQNNEMLIIGK